MDGGGRGRTETEVSYVGFASGDKIYIEKQNKIQTDPALLWSILSSQDAQWSLCFHSFLCSAGWGMEGVLWWTRSGNCGWVCHEIRHRVHIPSHDVSTVDFVFLSMFVCMCVCVPVSVCVKTLWKISTESISNYLWQAPKVIFTEMLLYIDWTHGFVNTVPGKLSGAPLKSFSGVFAHRSSC